MPSSAVTRVLRSTAAFRPPWSSISPTMVSRRPRLSPASIWLSWAATDSIALDPACVAIRLSAGSPLVARDVRRSWVNPLPDRTRSTAASSSAPGRKPLRKSPLEMASAVASGAVSLPRTLSNSSTVAKSWPNSLPSIREASWPSRFRSWLNCVSNSCRIVASCCSWTFRSSAMCSSCKTNCRRFELSNVGTPWASA